MSRAVRLCGVLLACAAAILALGLMYTVLVPPAERGSVTISTYILGEILENYSSGFVRRGLIGTLIQYATHHGAAMVFTTKLLYWNYAFFTIALTTLVLWRAKLKGWTLALILLMPGGIYSMACTREYFGRKEMFVYSALVTLGLGVSCLRAIRSRSRRIIVARSLIVALCLFAVFAALAHDGSVFMTGTASTLLFASVTFQIDQDTGRNRSNPRWPVLLYAIGNVLFFFLNHTVGRTTPATANAIWNSYSPADRALFAPHYRGGLEIFGLPYSFTLKQQFTLIFSGWAWYYLAPIAVLFLYCSLLVGMNSSGDNQEPDPVRAWASTYLIIFLCTSPLFLIAYDYGRWLDATPVSFIVVWLALGTERLAYVHDQLWNGPAKSNETGARLLGLAQQGLTDIRWIAQRKTTAIVCLMLLVCSTSHLHEMAIMVDSSYIPFQVVRVWERAENALFRAAQAPLGKRISPDASH